MYLQEALELPQTNNAQFQALLDALEAAKAAGDNKATLHVAEQLARQRGNMLDWYRYGYYLGISEDFDEALEIFRRVIASETNDAIIWFNDGIARCLLDMFAWPLSIFLDRAQRWLSILQEVAGDREEFSVALRLLDTAVRYRETEDKRVLLQLPLEERQLLEPLLKESPLNSKSGGL